MRLIPLSSLPAQRLQVVLDGQYCTIDIRQKGKRLYLDLAVADDPVCAGAVCVDGTDVLQSPSPGFDGSLHFYDLRGKAVPYWEDLGSRQVLLYLSEDEVIPMALRF